MGKHPPVLHGCYVFKNMILWSPDLEVLVLPLGLTLPLPPPPRCEGSNTETFLNSKLRYKKRQRRETERRKGRFRYRGRETVETKDETDAIAAHEMCSASCWDDTEGRMQGEKNPRGTKQKYQSGSSGSL